MDMMLSLPYVAVSLRGAATLTVILFTRHRLANILQKLNSLLARSLIVSGPNTQRYIRRWRLQISFVSVFFIAYLSATEYFNITGTIKQMNLTWTEGNMYDPLPPIFPVWLSMGFYETFLEVTFMLSIQVSILLIFSALVLTACTDRINDNLRLQTEITVSKKLDDLWKSTECLEDLLHQHAEVMDACKNVNAVFGLFFAVAYCLDFLALVSYVTNWLLNTALMLDNLWSAVYEVLITINVVVCGGMFLIPLFRMHDHALEIYEGLCNYADAAVPVLQSDQGNQLRRTLHLFMHKSRNQHIIIQGWHTVYATRHLFVATFTICVSFVVVAHEVLQKSR
ncbi:uncharacterized protein LOC129586015 [Paramacrobiotus metropolitanus]|uniref:uncharacterized protein LOC129586015 n=1 Tax=Paramacrobiotus metropolitanus TaxID=2943436 RepID=UPI002445B2B7|nr:uncharacterized protein LOC129586015 [Paramacrobiotus metropolitanus]